MGMSFTLLFQVSEDTFLWVNNQQSYFVCEGALGSFHAARKLYEISCGTDLCKFSCCGHAFLCSGPIAKFAVQTNMTLTK